MNDYKKRLKESWNCGKGCKGDSSERAYSKKEILEELSMEKTGLVKHKGKRKKNIKASLEYQIAWYTNKLQEFERSKNRSSFIVNRFRDMLEKLRAEYKKILEGKK